MPSDGTSSRCRRYASLRRRRARFLTTLPPSRRPTAKPTARGPGSRRQSSTNAGPSTRAPRRKSRSNSARDRSRSARGSPARAGAAPGTPLSLSTGDAPWRAAASAPSGRLSSTCAPGIRASWRAGDGSVGTSASRLPPSARNAHSPPILQMGPGSRQAPHGTARGRGAVAALQNPVLWWAARFRDGGARGVLRGASGCPGPRRQPSAAGHDGRAPESYPPPWISVCVTRSPRKASPCVTIFTSDSLVPWTASSLRRCWTHGSAPCGSWTSARPGWN